MMKKGFTLIELLVVIGIISALIAMESFVYINSQKTARDGKRKADLENIRAAVEQYRSANNSYPRTSKIAFNSSCTANGPLQDTNNNTYVNPLPSDPRCQLYKYYYSASPSNCDETTTVCNDYALGTLLEQASASCTVTGTNCLNNGIKTCNYCLGPYGTK